MSGTLPAVYPYQPHPIAAFLPSMDEKQLAALADSIKHDGLGHDITLFEGMVLDGRARQEACRRSGIIPRYSEFVGSRDEALAFVINQNVHRRHLSDEQRNMIAALMVNTEVGSNQHPRKLGLEHVPVGRASALVNVKSRTVGRYLPIARIAPDIANAVVSSRITFKTAQKMVELPQAERDRILSLDGNQQVLDAEVTSSLKHHRRSRSVVMPDGLFNVIVADFPWPIKPEPSYSTMSMDEIGSYLHNILTTKSADHCSLFLWVTEATREAASQMVKGVGWKIRELFTWHKSSGRCHPGRPFQNSEFVILAEKGKPEFIDTVGLRTCFYGQVGRHSEKPAEFFEMIKQATTGPRIEMFARKPHDGFEPHGNEIDWSAAAEVQEPCILSPDTDPSHEIKWIFGEIELSFNRPTFSVLSSDGRHQ